MDDDDMWVESDDDDTDEGFYDSGEVENVLEALMENDELGERRRRRRRRVTPSVSAIPTAAAFTTTRRMEARGFVTRAEFIQATDELWTGEKRNAKGIRTLNTRLGRVSGQVTELAAVNAAQSQRIARLDKLLKLDGVLDLVEGVKVSTTDNKLEFNFFQLLKGAVKVGALGDAKGFAGNPLVVGGAGLLLNNPDLLNRIAGSVGIGGRSDGTDGQVPNKESTARGVARPS